MLHLIPAPDGEMAVCRLCGIESHWLGDHVAEVHGMTIEVYGEQFPGAPTGSQRLVDKFQGQAHSERTPAHAGGLAVNFAGVSFPVSPFVPVEACLPMPPHYAVPKNGQLARDVQDMAIAIKRGRSTWLWGPPGGGKDAAVSALCAMTRRPSLLFTIVQGADITSWKFSRSFDSDGTFWEEGILLRALRDGYLAPNGERVPFLIVLSDIDRATRQQIEELRQVLDSIQGRITGPTGEVWPVVPGTVIVATANSSGAGDTTGRCISANPIDASILDRFERKIRFHRIDPRDEEPILKAKFPMLAERAPQAISTMLRASVAVREAVEKEEIYCEWSHRTICAWAGAAEDLLETIWTSKDVTKLVRRAVRVVLDGLPDLDTRENVKRVMDPHVKGGLVNEGDTYHIDPADLGF